MGIASKKFGIVVLTFQAIFLVLFALLTTYDTEANAAYPGNSRDPDKNGTDPEKNSVAKYYPMFQDVHVMIFIGFGFLMTFLKRYGFSAVGLNFLIAAFVLQWAILFHALLHASHGKLHIGIIDLLTADFAAAAVLISFGALLGKTSPLQLLIMAFIEIMIFSLNEWIGLSIFKAVDVGGSMFVHVFGAYFGLSAARVLYNPEVEKSSKEGSIYHSDIFSMLGTVFLWMYWPSFNSAVAAAGDDQHRAVINTYLALAACCVVTFAISSLTDKNAKFDMVHVQNATLAGGVAVGTSADMMIQPFGAVLIGCLAAVLSTVGYKYITPGLNSKLKIHDTCGVNNLHGMPGLLAGICGTVAAWFASTSTYGYSLYQTFPARAPLINTTALHNVQNVLSIVPGDGRSASTQAMYQAIALVVTFFVACICGALTGLLLRLPIFDGPRRYSRLFEDTLWWGTPEDFDEDELREPRNSEKNAGSELLTKNALDGDHNA